MLYLAQALNIHLSRPLGLLGNTIYKLASKFHLIPNAGADLESGGYAQVPGGARAEAERRRSVLRLYFYERWLTISCQCNGFEST